MGLNFTGEQVPMEGGGVSLRAQDTNSGKTVAIQVSAEVIQDIGLGRAMAMGEKKYDSGQIEPNGTVRVRTSDFNS